MGAERSTASGAELPQLTSVEFTREVPGLGESLEHGRHHRQEFLDQNSAQHPAAAEHGIPIADRPPPGHSLYSVQEGAPNIFLANGLVCVPNIRHPKLVGVVPQGSAYAAEDGDLRANLTLIFEDGQTPTHVNFHGFPLKVTGRWNSAERPLTLAA